MSVATLTPEAINYVCTTVRARSAIELDVSKSYLIEARLAPVAKDNGFDSINDLIQALRGQRQLKLESQLVEAMTTNETSFFRDQHPFETLRKTLFSEIKTRNAASKSLNIWSAACSTGQEIYSIAMHLREHFADLASWKVQLVGTDLSDDVLKRAAEARFSQIEVNRGLPASMLVKHFQRNGLHWELKPEVRNMARFMKLNLIERWPPLPVMDIVFLRNVLIYFCPETKRAILEKVRRVMAPNAVLFLGAAETTMGLDAGFERVQSDNSVYYRLK
ncbi:MAG: protein-glutamate O-methyltransferase CheR [Fuerstiella sp.]|jgi:chemotaxis protein methyltransferase CheR